MIKTGIAGADTPMAGELIRILVNHPDVDLSAVFAPGYTGRKLSSVHHGLTGETELEFSEAMNPEELDVVFVDAHSEVADRFREPGSPWAELRLIDMSHCPSLDFEALDMVYGLPEINRRRLVKEARRVVIPRSIADAALVSLAPLATHLLLNDDLHLHVECPSDLITDEKIEMAAREINHCLRKIQSSFDHEVTISATSVDSDRELHLFTDIKCAVDLGEIIRLYEEAYDDHSFTFVTLRPMDTLEVAGTDKCLISLTTPEPDVLHIDTVTDCRMRGGAGTAVHVMNLLFGLTERTGLALKTNAFLHPAVLSDSFNPESHVSQ